MVCILRFDCKKIILFIVITCLASVFFTLSASAQTDTEKNTDSFGELSDGIYNIIDTQTGLYLNVYDSENSTDVNAFLSERPPSGQDFLVKRQDDGSYIISPQNDDGVYSLSYHVDVMENDLIFKQEQLSNESKFTILPFASTNGKFNYSIKPTSLNDDMLSMGVASKSDKEGQYQIGLIVENPDSPQRWQFVKPSAESIKLDGEYVNIKVGSNRTIYSIVTPKYLGNNIQWSTSDPRIAIVSSSGKVYALSDGTAIITASCGTTSVSITVKCSPYTAYTWYSQHNPTSGGWWAESMNNVYFNTWAGARKRFFVKGYAGNSDWMDQGCKLCVEAMVLHNMGALLTDGYDFRYDKEGMLEADPYTTALANAGTDGVNYTNMWVPNNPILISHHMINPRFTVNGKAITTQEYYGGNLAHIKELLEQHPEGVVVGMNNYAKNTSHWVVFTECLNPDDPYGNYEFRICDPAAEVPELGDNVPFKESTSYLNIGYGYWSITSYSVYNIVE